MLICLLYLTLIIGYSLLYFIILVHLLLDDIMVVAMRAIEGVQEVCEYMEFCSTCSITVLYRQCLYPFFLMASW